MENTSVAGKKWRTGRGADSTDSSAHTTSICRRKRPRKPFRPEVSDGECETVSTGSDARLLGDGNPSRLAFSARLLLHLGDAEQHGGHHLADGPVEVDLLSNADDSQPLVAPLAQHVDAVAKAAAELR